MITPETLHDYMITVCIGFALGAIWMAVVLREINRQDSKHE